MTGSGRLPCDRLRGSRFHPLHGGEKRPLVCICFELLVNEDAVALLPRVVLQRQRNEIAEAAAGQGVLIREEAVVGLHTQFVSATHRLGDEIAAHSPGHIRGQRCSEEEPGVCAIPRPGALDRDGSADRSAGLGRRNKVLLPRILVEVDGEKPAGVIVEEGIDADRVSSLKMIGNDLIADGHEGLIDAVTASSAGPEQAQPWFPFVGAGWRVTRFAGLLAHKANGEDICPTAKQRPEQAHLLAGGARRGAIQWRRRRRERCWPGGRDSKFRAKRFDPSARVFACAPELSQPRFLTGELLKHDVSRARHESILVHGSAVPGNLFPDQGNRVKPDKASGSQ